jgi:hypothetical protein
VIHAIAGQPNIHPIGFGRDLDHRIRVDKAKDGLNLRRLGGVHWGTPQSQREISVRLRLAVLV